MHGINPKRWFYRLGEHLQEDVGDRLVFTGAACEQWVNGLLFRVIAERLPPTLTAFPEWNGRQHDIAVLPVGRRRGTSVVDWERPKCVVENKLIYRGYSPGKRRGHVARLMAQLQTEGSAPQRVGLLLGVYVHRLHEPDPAESPKQFRINIGRAFRDGVASVPASWGATLDHGGTIETILPFKTAKVGGEEILVGCVGQYVVLRKKRP